MTLTSWLWLATGCYAAHILEEYQLNWRDWARQVIGLRVEWGDFYVTNAVVIVLGIVAPNLAVAWPALALTFPALMLINATFFHVLPVILTKGRYSPGVFTAVILFYPVGIACFARAATQGLIGVGAMIVSFVLGALIMAFPIVLLKVRSLPYFRQDR
jgi:hypothetical protein